MDREHDKLFLRTRGDQFDMGVLACIRYGISLSEWQGELTEPQRALARRLDEETTDEEGQLLSLSAAEAQLAAEAIERNVAFEIRNQGTVFNSDTRQGSEALPVILEVAQTVRIRNGTRSTV